MTDANIIQAQSGPTGGRQRTLQVKQNRIVTERPKTYADAIVERQTWWHKTMWTVLSSLGDEDQSGQARPETQNKIILVHSHGCTRGSEKRTFCCEKNNYGHLITLIVGSWGGTFSLGWRYLFTVWYSVDFPCNIIIAGTTLDSDNCLWYFTPSLSLSGFVSMVVV